MPDSGELLAKSAQKGREAESLRYHLTATLGAANEVAHRVGRLDLGDRVLSGRFWDTVRIAAVSHDAGKVPQGFQDMLRGLRKTWGERHEVLSLGFLPPLVADRDQLLWVASAVVTHHRALTAESGAASKAAIAGLYRHDAPETLRARFNPIDLSTVDKLADWLSATVVDAGLPVTGKDESFDVVAHAHAVLHEVLAAWEMPADPDVGLTAVLLQGAVTLADHLSSARGTLQHVQPIDSNFPQHLHERLAAQGSCLHRHQERAGKVDGHLIVRAPTGTGKTESSLLWVSRQVEVIAAATGGTPRAFFLLPYLASINAMSLRLGDLLVGGHDVVGVAHSRAASFHLSVAIAAEDGGPTTAYRVDAAHKAVAREEATRLFREPVRVGTPYQLLRGVLAGPAHSGILIDSANSVFILDELHAYDTRRLGYILSMAGLWERLGGRIAVLSATLPNALVQLIRDSLRDSVSCVDADDAHHPVRHRIRIRDHHLGDDAATGEMRDRLIRGESVLVIANNVEEAWRLFDALEPLARELYGPEGALLLHSRFRRVDRNTIEGLLRSRYRTASGSSGPRTPGLLVATQVVEVSLDVDFDVLFTAAAPLEALLQRFGRVNRLGHRQPADVIIHPPLYRTRRRSRGEEYADGVYPREPVEAAWQVLRRNADSMIDESEASAWLDEIYATPWGERWREEVQKNREDFDCAFVRFDYPFDDRELLAETFDTMFEGTEAILAEDREKYAAALGRAPGRPGRLTADELLIPLPYWSGALPRYDKDLRVRFIDGEYASDRGLIALHGDDREAYRPGEVV